MPTENVSSLHRQHAPGHRECIHHHSDMDEARKGRLVSPASKEVAKAPRAKTSSHSASRSARTPPHTTTGMRWRWAGIVRNSSPKSTRRCRARRPSRRPSTKGTISGVNGWLVDPASATRSSLLARPTSRRSGTRGDTACLERFEFIGDHPHVAPWTRPGLRVWLSESDTATAYCIGAAARWSKYNGRGRRSRSPPRIGRLPWPGWGTEEARLVA